MSKGRHAKDNCIAVQKDQRLNAVPQSGVKRLLVGMLAGSSEDGENDRERSGLKPNSDFAPQMIDESG